MKTKLVNPEVMKAGFPPTDIKFTDRLRKDDAFDAYHAEHDLSAMETYLRMLKAPDQETFTKSQS